MSNEITNWREIGDRAREKRGQETTTCGKISRGAKTSKCAVKKTDNMERERVE